MGVERLSQKPYQMVVSFMGMTCLLLIAKEVSGHDWQTRMDTN
jgi:hypothetical protein